MTSEEFGLHLQRLASYLRRGEAHALVIDIGEGDLDGENRRQLAEHHRVHAGAVRELVRGVALVVRAPIHRVMYGAIDALLGAPYPFRRFASFEEAEVWAGQVVGQRAASRPPAQ